MRIKTSTLIKNSDNLKDLKKVNFKNQFQFIKLRKYAGFNAIELTLVLAVIAIAIIAVVKVMGGNTDKQNSNQMVNDVGTMVSNIKNAYSSSTTGYTDLSSAIAVKMHAVPADLKVDEGKGIIKSQFQGGTVDIKTGPNPDSFTITYDKVPTAVCTNVVTTLGTNLFQDVLIAGKSVYNGGILVTKDIAAQCGSTKLVTVSFQAG